MFDGWTQDAMTKGGVLGGAAVLFYGVLRMVGMKASKDLTTLKADASGRQALQSLQKRVEQLDSRVGEIEYERNQMFGFITKCMAYIAQCQCADIKPPTREELLQEYEKLISSFNPKRRHADKEKA